MLRHRRGMRFRWYRQLRGLTIRREPSRPTLRRDRRCRSRSVRRGTSSQSPIAAGERARSAYGGDVGVAATASDRRGEVHP